MMFKPECTISVETIIVLRYSADNKYIEKEKVSGQYKCSISRRGEFLIFFKIINAVAIVEERYYRGNHVMVSLTHRCKRLLGNDF